MPATPNSQLQNEYQKEIDPQGLQVKVVEKVGRLQLRGYSRSLTRSNCDSVSERTAQYVRQMGKGRAIEKM